MALTLAERQSPAVYDALGAVLNRLGRTGEAEEQFRKAKVLAQSR